MATRYHNKGLDWNITTDEAMNLKDRLPPNNFVIKITKEGSLYLSKVPSFTLPERIYGNVNGRAERILSTYADRSKRGVGTGVLLEGDKGSGKTLLAKKLSIDGAAAGIPTVIINDPFGGDAFSMLIQSIDQPCIFLFDEFEKVYGAGLRRYQIDGPEDHGPTGQSELLTLLDGVWNSPKLFVLTANDSFKIDSRMMNRPGRIYYSYKYKGLARDMVIEYAKDNLKNHEHLGEINSLACMFENLNFDMLQAVVEESNRYSEPPLQAAKQLNIVPEGSRRKQYAAKLFINGKEVGLSRDWMEHADVSEGDFEEGQLCVDPSRAFMVRYYLKDVGGINAQKDVRFSPDNLKEADVTSGTYTFVKDKFTLNLERIQESERLFERDLEF